MVRSLNSGVAALKSHQTRLDVIGNNIANVNTYGFKGSRVTFRDLYYQSTKGAAAPGSGGGINPSQIGYGSTMGSIDVLHGQAALTTTGNPLDLAISGEGFFQVMDGEGNKYYTRAGMLDIDSAGNLIDTNGNFILGVNGKAVGKAADSQKITLAIPSVDPAAAKAEVKFDNGLITIEAGQNTTAGNVGFSITAADLPYGEKARAEIKSGSIVVQLNGKETFDTFAEVQSAISAAIENANEGKAHPAGPFTITVDKAKSDALFGVAGDALKLTGQQVCATVATPEKDLTAKFHTGTNTGVDTDIVTGITITDIGELFPGATGGKLTVTENGDKTTTLKFTAGGNTYQVIVPYSGNDSVVKNGGDFKLCKYDSTATPPSYDQKNFITINMTSAGYTACSGVATGLTADIKKNEPGKALGLGQNIKLTGGTEGGPQTVKDLSSIAIGADGVITGVHGILGELELGRIDLATFDNPKGLAEVGDTYFQATENSGTATPNKIGEGGTGSVVQSMLEMSSVDISEEFTNMITTQRGFQANSRIVTVTDTMLEELINLKR